MNRFRQGTALAVPKRHSNLGVLTPEVSAWPGRKACAISIGKMRLRVVFALVCAATVFGATPVHAQNSDKLTLRQAVTLALQNSREIALARMQYTVALNAAGVNRADFRPNLYTGSGAAYSSGFPATVGGSAPAIISLSYTQSIFNLPLRGQLHAAEDRAESQKIELDRTRDAVIVHRHHLPGT